MVMQSEGSSLKAVEMAWRHCLLWRLESPLSMSNSCQLQGVVVCKVTHFVGKWHDDLCLTNSEHANQFFVGIGIF